VLETGDKAPAFTLEDQDGNEIELSRFAGKKVVLYFYPRDDTPGCTKEACAFRDDLKKIEKAGAVVLGISPDGVESHQKFAKKFRLPFPLLADVGHAVAEKYGAWGEKNMYGKKVKGIIRSTFLIGADGKIARVWPRVKVDGHASAVLEELGR
jgi:peroxiredoxin Q/BCP